jgi:hypothetical protein
VPGLTQVVAVDEQAGILLMTQQGNVRGASPYLQVRDARDGKLIRQLARMGPAGPIDPSRINEQSARVDEQTGNIFLVSGPHTVGVLSPRGWRIVREVHIPGGSLLIDLAQGARRLIAVGSRGKSGAVVTVLCADLRC